jgi:hypothetical protein
VAAAECCGRTKASELIRPVLTETTPIMEAKDRMEVIRGNFTLQVMVAFRTEAQPRSLHLEGERGCAAFTTSPGKYVYHQTGNQCAAAGPGSLFDSV